MFVLLSILLLNSIIVNGQEVESKKYLSEKDSASLDININLPKSSLFKRPVFISTSYIGGSVLKSSESLRNNTNCALPYAQYANIKLGFSSEGNRWKDILYGMPYYGVGMGVYDFSYNNLGNPISVYLVQGATLKTFTSNLRLKYEWNFGCSFNWKIYDPITNPTNENIGAKANIYFAANVFFTYPFSKYIDVEVGAVYNHVSNGATKMPNSGINTIGGMVGFKYHFNPERIMNEWNPDVRAPEYENSRLLSDISIHPTRRQRKLKTEKTGLSTEYIDHDFFVFNASYALLHMPTYKHRYGVGLDFTYDESSRLSAQKIGEEPNGREIAKITYGNVKNRFSVGICLRGDIVMPKYTVFGKVGYNVLHGDDNDPRFYQAFGVKAPIWNNMYGSFAIQAKHFSKAEYFFLGIGCYIDHSKFSYRKKS